MFVNKRIRNHQEFKYLEHSFRIGHTVKKISIYLPLKKTISLEEFEKRNEHEIKKIAQERVNFIKKTYDLNKFFVYTNILQNIESIRTSFQVMMDLLDEAGKKRVYDEFIRTFIVNSLEMEGGTVTYETAKKIDLKRLIKKPDEVNEVDITLYKNVQDTYKKMSELRLRSAHDIANVHKMMYQNIYTFAGKFRKIEVTFGVTENAITSDSRDIRKRLVLAIHNFKKDKKNKYLFENILRFHTTYEAIHPFRDGNSRLGRLLVAMDFFKEGYPPPILKKTNAQAYRSSLVKAINYNNYTSLLKLYYKVYKKTWFKFFKPLIYESIRGNSKHI
ncbi:Fic family protein [Candidatus Woesearchaeota archaeon]|nr:Fic family protein [Candidatus Woesearchaeota archaeon]